MGEPEKAKLGTECARDHCGG